VTPTLAGRWQTRLFLMSTAGLGITLIFGYLYENFLTPLVLLGYVLIIGFICDILYNYGQSLRWDRDWPPIFFVGAGLIEALLLWGLIKATFIWQLLFGLAGLPGVDPALRLGQFAAHYSTVWLTTFLIMLGPLKVVFLKWRYRGGQLW
jgi:hypothetical protein